MKRVRSVSEVRDAESRRHQWWGRREGAISAIGVGSVGVPLAVCLAIDTGAPLFLLLVAPSLLLAVYGAWDIRRVGPLPPKRDDFQPHA